MNAQFRVELVWVDDDPSSRSSIYLTSDGGIILRGAAVTEEDRQRLELPDECALVRVDKKLITAIKNML